MDPILENRLINGWIAHWTKAPHQINDPHTSDAELFELREGSGVLLAASIDTIAEEIALGFFEDPYCMGWMGVMVNFSDLAAVGAHPLGVLLSVSLPEDGEGRFQERMAQGIADACGRLGTYVLGGDTNRSERCTVTGCALGVVDRDRLMTRRGCRPGELVFATGRFGAGNALAAAKLLQLGSGFYPEEAYRPVARIEEARVVARYASCCMDSSDGLITTLDQLMRVNGVGFRITEPLASLVREEIGVLCRNYGLSPWLFLAAQHGEFELVFTVPPERREAFLAEAGDAGMAPVLIGATREAPEMTWGTEHPVTIDSARVRNLYEMEGGNVGAYVQQLAAMGSGLE